MLLTSKICLKKYGEPVQKSKFLTTWDVPAELEIGMIPKKIYCNIDIVEPLTKAFRNLIQRKHVNEIVTFDGCFNIRKKRGLASMSLHSWGVAVDFNAFANPLGFSRQQCIDRGLTPFTDGFVKCFTDAGFDWGGNWKRPDGMHFQLSV
jgi:hypothetical protein